jgi:SAM-dependent methyltransferase
LSPPCGHGAFLVAAVERLLDAATRHARPVRELTRAIRAYDIDPAHVALTREAVTATLRARDVSARDARTLAEAWVREGDSLLTPLGATFDFIVGNPPYVRIEQLAPALQAEYRARYATLYDRADLYVAFIERGLKLLAPDGVLCFVCADRWVLNRYGAPLRALVARDHRVRCYLDLHDASPFESEVIAYPSIFALSRGRTERVFVGRLDRADAEECSAMRAAWRGETDTGAQAALHESWFEGDAPWVLASPEQLRALRDLEARFDLLEADGSTRVGIGVATGCDRVFIVDADANIEPERLVPLVMRSDLQHGRIGDARRRVINTFRDDGAAIDLRAWAPARGVARPEPRGRTRAARRAEEPGRVVSNDRPGVPRARHDAQAVDS